VFEAVFGKGKRRSESRLKVHAAPVARRIRARSERATAPDARGIRPPPHLEDADRRAESLRHLIESISGELALEPLLTRIVESAVTLLGAEDGTIGLVMERPGGPVIHTAAIYNMPVRELGAEMPPGVGLAGRVLLERRPVLLDRYGDLDQPVLHELHAHAVIGIPIWWGDVLVGFFGIGARPPRRFHEQDVETLALFARHAAIAIENARLFEAERRRAARISTIARIGRLIAGSLSLEQIFQTAVQAISELLQIAYAAAGIVDPDDEEQLLLVAQAGAYVDTVPDSYRQSIHEGLVGVAARTRQRIVVNDVARDQRYLPVLGADAICAELAVPIIVGNELLGVLNVESEHPLGEDDAEGIEIIADELGVAIINARLFAAEQRRAARITTINQIGRLIGSSLDLDEILQTAVEAINAHLQFPHVALLLVDPQDPEMLALRARSGIYAAPDLDGYQQSSKEGIIGAAIYRKERILVNGVARDPRYIPVPGGHAVRAELAVPISMGNRLLGVLNIESERRIREDDADGIAIMADQIGIAIDNARLFAAMQVALRETELLHETARRISTAMTVEEVVGAYLEQVAARGRYACSILLHETVEGGRGTGLIKYGSWTPGSGLRLGREPTPHAHDALDPMLDAGQTVTIVDVRADPRVPVALRDGQLQQRRPAVAMIPLMVRGQRIGLVVLDAPSVEAWREADLQIYQATAAQLATAIDSRQQQLLLYERGQQLAVLEERQRLARDLHDSVTQLIFSMTLIAQSIAPAWHRDPSEGERRIGRLLELSQTTLAEMRALLAELRPADTTPAISGEEPASAGITRVRRDGLLVALRQHIAELVYDSGPRIDVAAQGYVRQTADLEEALYRITQEALNNVIKHARARGATIRLQIDEAADAVLLEVADDGNGFAPLQPGTMADPGPGGGLGLTTMRERAAALGGTFRLVTAEGSGTTVEVLLPRRDGGRL
jgi:GAF domain-containing protein/anti-sigma regulatory factor (Ser/Thr protein kinase)